MAARTMPRVRLDLPGVLRPIAGRTSFDLAGRTAADVLEAAFAEVPVLRRHLTTDDGDLRAHILLLRNGESVPRELAPSSVEVEEGDELAIFQAISGG